MKQQEVAKTSQIEEETTTMEDSQLGGPGTKKRLHKKNMDPKDLQRMEQLKQKGEQDKLYQKQSQSIDTLAYFSGARQKQLGASKDFQRPFDRPGMPGGYQGASILARPPGKT